MTNACYKCYLITLLLLNSRRHPSTVLILTSCSKTRGHAYKLYKPRCENAIRRNFFVERVVNVWNSLPSSVKFFPLTSLCDGGTNEGNKTRSLEDRKQKEDIRQLVDVACITESPRRRRYGHV